MYNSNKFKEAVSILNQLEAERLRNPRVLHLKILAQSNFDIKDLTSETFNDLKKNVNKYLKDYDIKGLEDKYKEVYEVSKKLKIIESNLVKNKADELFKNKDFDNALVQYLKSYEMGYEELDLYLSIIEVKQELSKKNQASKSDINLWKEKAADLGHIPSCIEMGFLYKEGIKVPQDVLKAAKYFKMANGSNLPGANYGNGWLYMFAVDVKHDWFAAREMFLAELKNKEYFCEAYYQILNRNDRDEVYHYIVNSPPSNHQDYYCRERMVLIYCKFRSNKLLLEESINSLKIGADEFNSPLAQLYLFNVFSGIFKVKGVKINNELAEKYLADFNKNPNNINKPYIYYLIANHYHLIDLFIETSEPFADELYSKYDQAIKNGSFEAIQQIKIQAKNANKNQSAIKLLKENNIEF